jgi:SH3 domain protein
VRSITAFIIVICSTLPLAIAYAGQKQWVSDQLPLDMRSGNSNGHRVIKMLEPGTMVTVLKVDKKAQFTQVVTSEGTKGWLTNRYLMSQPSGREQLAKAQATIAKLRQGSEPLHANLITLEQQVATLDEQLAKATGKSESSERELAHIQEVSANAMTLDKSNQSLMEANQLLQHELDVLEGENSRLNDSSKQAWFIKGALAVCLGAILAIAIPHISPSRTSKEWR